MEEFLIACYNFWCIVAACSIKHHKLKSGAKGEEEEEEIVDSQEPHKIIL